MTKSKKEWVEPELIVLVRSKPEEAVLAVCKADASGSSTQSADGGCWEYGFCSGCLIVPAS